MMKRLIDKFKLRHYKEIVFVDSENVGYSIPSQIPKDALVYLFIGDQNIIKKLNVNNHIKIINISTIRNLNSTKNIMDFCIISKISLMAPLFSNKHKIVLLSKDKGYDPGIKYLLKEFPKLNIIRYPGSLMTYYSNQNDVIMSKMNDHVLDLISKHSDMKSLKKYLSKKQKELFVVKRHVDEISNISVSIEFDIYKNVYSVYKSGTCVFETVSKDEAIDRYNGYIDSIKDKYKKYETHEKFCMSNKLKIRVYIEEAALKELPLRDCLISHLGAYEGDMLYRMYEGTKPN